MYGCSLVFIVTKKDKSYMKYSDLNTWETETPVVKTSLWSNERPSRVIVQVSNKYLLDISTFHKGLSTR